MQIEDDTDKYTTPNHLQVLEGVLNQTITDSVVLKLSEGEYLHNEIGEETYSLQFRSCVFILFRYETGYICEHKIFLDSVSNWSDSKYFLDELGDVQQPGSLVIMYNQTYLDFFRVSLEWRLSVIRDEFRDFGLLPIFQKAVLLPVKTVEDRIDSLPLPFHLVTDGNEVTVWTIDNMTSVVRQVGRYVI